MINPRIFRHLRQESMCLLALLAAATSGPAAAQDPARAAIEFASGWVGFADDAVVSESLIGGGVRLHLRPRIRFGPEIAYIDGHNHRHLMVTGNVTCDFFPPTGEGPRRLTPFVVAGGGLFQTRGDFFNRTVSSSEGAFTAGGDVRGLVGDRVTIGVEARVGWELHLRINGLVGVQLGRRQRL